MEPITSSKPASTALDNYSKGGLFEWYVVRLFNRQHFRLQEWRRSRKMDNPQDLAGCGFPDIEWELVFSEANRYGFAVECKWREGFRDGKIRWAMEDEMEGYRKPPGNALHFR